MSTGSVVVVRALVRRALNEILRVPGAAIPGVLAPTIFMLGLSSVFGKAGDLAQYHGVDFRTFVVPVGLLQGAAFTGAATGVNLARDIEQGWFDRLVLCPTPRPTLLAGVVSSAALRALLPGSFLLLVAFILGVPVPSALGFLVVVVLIMGLASCLACFSVTLALVFRTQQAAPLMQIAGFIGVLFTTSYAPHDGLAPWLRVVSDVNPVTRVLDGVRQAFIGGVTWHDTWPALLAIAGMVTVLGALAARGLRRYGA